jgi:hypothetical protein
LADPHSAGICDGMLVCGEVKKSGENLDNQPNGPDRRQLIVAPTTRRQQDRPAGRWMTVAPDRRIPRSCGRNWWGTPAWRRRSRSSPRCGISAPTSATNTWSHWDPHCVLLESAIATPTTPTHSTSANLAQWAPLDRGTSHDARFWRDRNGRNVMMSRAHGGTADEFAAARTGRDLLPGNVRALATADSQLGQDADRLADATTANSTHTTKPSTATSSAPRHTWATTTPSHKPSR